ncbi:hypothetical protein SAMN02745123_02393 [Desulforamulus aeronauticus DSM 10349]|uniref:Uncharacterized protein n=1 Tax=Desulforamulus aeronauticus DSM 10349 TaxID=1121421 RepID=A0A1M6TNC1_9FIRM|nr:hypothetical protein SAMN02745123_02393 [Desulforamulus aeronauticus DSM 10349]
MQEDCLSCRIFIDCLPNENSRDRQILEELFKEVLNHHPAK